MKFGLENIATLCEALGHPEQRLPVDHRRRHERQGLGDGDGRHGAARRRAPERALHVAAPRAARRTVRHRRRGGRRPSALDARPARIQAGGRGARRVRRARRRCRRSSSARRRSPSSCSASARVDVAVLEVGLGGRLDATNVVSPIAAAITSIDFDHQAAARRHARVDRGREGGRHQAGHPGRVRPAAGRGARRSSPRSCAERGATLIRTDTDAALVGARRRRCRSRWPARHQQSQRRRRGAACSRRSIATSRRGLRVGADGGARGPRDRRLAGAARAFTPRRRAGVLLDAAHNPAGARALASYLRRDRSRRRHARVRRDARQGRARDADGAGAGRGVDRLRDGAERAGDAGRRAGANWPARARPARRGGRGSDRGASRARADTAGWSSWRGRSS